MSVTVYRSMPADFSSSIEIASCYCEHDGKFLWLKRAPHKPQPHTWDMPGGKLEPGEAPMDAACREALEEVSLVITDPTYVGKVYVRYHDMDFVYHMFHHTLSEKPDISLSEAHVDHRWMTFEEARDHPLIDGETDVMAHFIDFRCKAALHCRKSLINNKNHVFRTNS